jgi:heat shock protein HtpX
MKRIFLFVATNVAVLLVISVVLSLLGVRGYLERNDVGGVSINYQQLLIVSLVIGFAGSFISLAMSKFIAKMAYGIMPIGQPRSEAEAWVKQTVADQAKKAGIRTPEVGIYESPEVNAFATGPSRNNALVAVSSGMIRGMSLRQIEGVLAHEVSHVANGDMVTMALLQGVLNTFVVFLSRILGLIIDNFLRRGDDNRGGVGIGYWIASMVCQVFLSILASLIVFAYSRRREFAADAMAAKLAGKDAMIGALQRLKQVSEGGGVLDDRSPALSAFKISGKAKGFGHLFATHPPLVDRIAALERLR